MTRYTKLATCLFLLFIGLVGYIIYIGLEGPSTLRLSFNTIEGDEQIAQQLDISGSIEYATSGTQSELTRYELAQIGTPHMVSSDTFRYTENETSVESDLSFLDSLDNHASVSPFINQLRLEKPNFLRNKGLYSLQVLNTEEAIYTANFKGDYQLSRAGKSSELHLERLDKSTDDIEHYRYTLELDSSVDNHAHALYQTEEQLTLLISSTVENQEHRTWSFVTFDKDTHEFSETSLGQGSFSLLPYAEEQRNEAFVLLERTEEPEDIYDEAQTIGYNFIDMETGEQHELPTIEQQDNQGSLPAPVVSDDTIYAVQMNEENSSYDSLELDKEQMQWEAAHSIDLLIEEEARSTNVWDHIAETPFDFLEYRFANGQFIVYTYSGSQEQPIHLQMTDLSTGELSYYGQLTLEGADEYEEANLFIESIR